MESGLRRYRSSCDLSQCGQWEGGRFRSKWYRGLGRQMEWLRLKLDGQGPFHVRVYACDTPPEDFHAVEEVPALEWTAGDLILYGIRGWYLAFTVEPGALLEGFELTFPGRSIAEGLPFVLQGDDTLRTLLAVYQSGYMDLNGELRDFPRRLDPTAPDALPELPCWLGARRWTMDPSVTKKLLPDVPLLARLRGTRRGLTLLARLVTGYSCQVVEGWRLYGQPGEGVTLLLPAQVSRGDADAFRALLPDFIPLGVPYRLIHLEDGAPMDGDSYLDENTVLTEQPMCMLDGPETDEVLLE